MQKFFILISLIFLSIQVSQGCDSEGKTGFAPKNNLWIGETNSLSEMTEAEFNQVIDRVESIYTPIIEAKGKKFEIIRKWKDGTVNAYAQQSGKTWKVSMFGGLARHKEATVDGFALVLCHETGHHLGGAPKTTSLFGRSTWASNEGQSDYWGSMKCLRKFMEKDDNVGIVANLNVDPVVKERCEKTFTHENDVAMCIRGAYAGLALGNLLNSLSRSETRVKFDTPSKKVVSRTNMKHPPAQCRLDTYFSGSVCERDHYSDVDNVNADQGVCNRKQRDSSGIRPLCWFKPKKY